MKKLVIANWKMNYGPVQAGAWVRAFRRERLPKDLDVAIAVPFVSLPAARASLGRATLPSLAAQDVFWENDGAYTGEISPAMLQEFGVVMCLVGHSERRALLGETDEMAGKKAAALQKAGIMPVICVGETGSERKKGATLKVVRNQVAASIAGLKPDGRASPIFAYEPVWAIGTGRACHAQDAQTAHEAIRGACVRTWGPKWAHDIRIVYGGSVDSRNIIEYMTTTGIDGALVGGASLDPRGFGFLCRAAAPV